MSSPATPIAAAPAVMQASMRVPTGARSMRRTELWLLLLAMSMVAAYLAAVEANLLGRITSDFWVPVSLLTMVFVALHVVIRLRAPFADPVLMPAVALLNGLGVTFLRRLDLGRVSVAERPELTAFTGDGGRQLVWTLIAVSGAAGFLWLVRDHRSISKYAWTLGLTGIVLVMLPAMLPGTVSEVNGAKLWIKFGDLFAIQPGEFAKLALLVFFAYYLVRKREVLALASRRFLGIDFPRGRDLGPVLVVWVMSLLVLIFEKDLGTSLLYFGMFVVTLYVATERVSWLIIGLLLFFGGASLAYLLAETAGGPFASSLSRWVNWSIVRAIGLHGGHGQPGAPC